MDFYRYYADQGIVQFHKCNHMDGGGLALGLATDTPVMVNLTRNYAHGFYALPLMLAAIGLYLEKYRGLPRLAESS